MQESSYGVSIPMIGIRMEYDILREADLFWVLNLVKKSARSVALQDESLLPEPRFGGKRPRIELAIVKAETGKSIDVFIVFYCWEMAVSAIEFVRKTYRNLKDSSEKQTFRAHRRTRRTETVRRIFVSEGIQVVEEEVTYEVLEHFELEFTNKK